jgi:hypothetical protein
VLLSTSVLAHAGSRWIATSSTSMAITGNIVVTENSIRFGNGNVVGLNPTGVPEVFTLLPPGTNPVLLQGNRLCGEQPPTYVTLYREGRSLALSVYDGPDMPGTPTQLTSMQPGMCASYFYER